MSLFGISSFILPRKLYLCSPLLSGGITLVDRNYEVCIPSKSNRKIQIPHDKALYRKRHKIENMFGKLKDWRRIHTRYDRCAHTFMSAIAIAAIVIFWI
jgi:transposase